MDREKVIKGLECIAQKRAPMANPCKDCGYSDRLNYAICVKDIAYDALALLKEQEPVRCKDCGYWDDSTKGRYVGGWCFCDRLKFSTSPDWFCADGEKKGENHE